MCEFCNDFVGPCVVACTCTTFARILGLVFYCDRATKFALKALEDVPAWLSGEYAVPSVVSNIPFHSLPARVIHALVELMDLLRELESDACAYLVPQTAERDLSSKRIDSSIPSNDRSFLDLSSLGDPESALYQFLVVHVEHFFVNGAA